VRFAVWIAIAIAVILVIGLIASVVMEGWPGSAETRRHNRAENEIHVAAAAIESWSSNHAGAYPDARTFATLHMLPGSDPWGHPYRYEHTATAYYLGCSGRDGKWERARLSEYRRHRKGTSWDGDIVYGSR
jgi:hypothetical protein